MKYFSSELIEREKNINSINESLSMSNLKQSMKEPKQPKVKMNKATRAPARQRVSAKKLLEALEPVKQERQQYTEWRQSIGNAFIKQLQKIDTKDAGFIDKVKGSRDIQEILMGYVFSMSDWVEWNDMTVVTATVLGKYLES